MGKKSEGRRSTLEKGKGKRKKEDDGGDTVEVQRKRVREGESKELCQQPIRRKIEPQYKVSLKTVELKVAQHQQQQQQ